MQGVAYFKNIKLFFSALPLVCKVVIRNIKKKKFEPEAAFLDQIIKSDSICLDIGGAYGRYSYPMSRLARAGRVFSFEPGQHSFFVLRFIKMIFRLKNVELINNALGKESKEEFLVSPIKKKGNTGHSLSYLSAVVVPGAKNERIAVITMDGFTREVKLDRLDFIKCDTEGAEMLIFYGGEQTIKKFRPVILAEMESGHLQKFNNSLQEVTSFFKNLGYDFFRIEDNKFCEVLDLDQDGNYFFIPREKRIKTA